MLNIKKMLRLLMSRDVREKMVSDISADSFFFFSSSGTLPEGKKSHNIVLASLFQEQFVTRSNGSSYIVWSTKTPAPAANGSIVFWLKCKNCKMLFSLKTCRQTYREEGDLELEFQICRCAPRAKSKFFPCLIKVEAEQLENAVFIRERPKQDEIHIKKENILESEAVYIKAQESRSEIDITIVEIEPQA